jgi:hypothetical protein
MEADLAAWPARLDQAVAQARTEVSKELGQQRAAETRELKLVHQHELSLASFKAQTLEQTLKAQTAEIDGLKRQLHEAQSQLKDMAVVVIEGRANAERTTSTSDYRATSPAADASNRPAGR